MTTALPDADATISFAVDIRFTIDALTADRTYFVTGDGAVEGANIVVERTVQTRFKAFLVDASGRLTVLAGLGEAELEFASSKWVVRRRTERLGLHARYEADVYPNPKPTAFDQVTGAPIAFDGPYDSRLGLVRLMAAGRWDADVIGERAEYYVDGPLWPPPQEWIDQGLIPTPHEPAGLVAEKASHESQKFSICAGPNYPHGAPFLSTGTSINVDGIHFKCWSRAGAPDLSHVGLGSRIRNVLVSDPVTPLRFREGDAVIETASVLGVCDWDGIQVEAMNGSVVTRLSAINYGRPVHGARAVRVLRGIYSGGCRVKNSLVHGSWEAGLEASNLGTPCELAGGWFEVGGAIGYGQSNLDEYGLGADGVRVVETVATHVHHFLLSGRGEGVFPSCFASYDHSQVARLDAAQGELSQWFSIDKPTRLSRIAFRVEAMSEDFACMLVVRDENGALVAVDYPDAITGKATVTDMAPTNGSEFEDTELMLQPGNYQVAWEHIAGWADLGASDAAMCCVIGVQPRAVRCIDAAIPRVEHNFFAGWEYAVVDKDGNPVLDGNGNPLPPNRGGAGVRLEQTVPADDRYTTRDSYVGDNWFLSEFATHRARVEDFTSGVSEIRRGRQTSTYGKPTKPGENGDYARELKPGAAETGWNFDGADWQPQLRANLMAGDSLQLQVKGEDVLRGLTFDLFGSTYRELYCPQTSLRLRGHTYIVLGTGGNAPGTPSMVLGPNGAWCCGPVWVPTPTEQEPAGLTDSEWRAWVTDALDAKGIVKKPPGA